ncbi:prenyltransferase/squalene oxidase repeat-containing protein [Streptosporangium sp. CA-115845]|uniref:prenyltransferase/squalene oxidase repeat-containing protein n=1 Tax=Streptosporangium sp. CA-115845 TaxID=3240071 RepID=UPI003D929FED
MPESTDLSSVDISRSLNGALSCLSKTYRSNPDGSGGWYHYLDDLQPGVTASAVGLFTFDLVGSHFDCTAEVLRYLLSEQERTPEGELGGWSVRTTEGFAVLEATAWVVRALSRRGVADLKVVDALRGGVEWLKRNQNPDRGWGSHLNEPSRVFHTALATLAMQESGGDPEVIAGGVSWLIKAQNSQLSAWGPLPGKEPTLLHTSIALWALSQVPGGLEEEKRAKCMDWILQRLATFQHVERSTQVEEFNVPYIRDGANLVFQNSLPHFAGPVAVIALLSAGVDPLNPRIFQAAAVMMRDQQRDGHWELPRSPERQSVWAIWPYVAALSALRSALFVTDKGSVKLISPGCALVFSSEQGRKVGVRTLFRTRLHGWWLAMRQAKILLWAVSIVAVTIFALLLNMGTLTLNEFLLAMALPVLLMVFQISWDTIRRRREQDKSG